MVSANDLVPATLFLVLYLVFFVGLTVGYARRKIAWKSRYSFVYFHVITRIGGQICGVGFSAMSWDDFSVRLNMLLAFLILSAEGYFSLVLCAYRFLIVWQQDRFGESELEPRIAKGTSFGQRMNIVMKSQIGYVHWALIAANAIIISGGSILSSAMSKPDDEDAASKSNTGKAMRVAGTAIFLALVQVFFLLALKSYKRKGDRTLLLIIFTWPCLTVRGAFGIVQVVVPKFSYYNFDVYTQHGIKSNFLAGEYVLSTAMEWLACGFLLSTYFSSITGGETIVEDWERGHAAEEDTKSALSPSSPSERRGAAH